MPLTVEVEPLPGPGPVASRLAAGIVRAIGLGRLRDGDTLPSSRALASGLGLARSQVVTAYEELAIGGYVRARPGSATVVAPGAEVAARAGTAPRRETPASATGIAVERPAYDLAPGYPDVRLIASKPWDAAWRRAHGRGRAASPYSMVVHGDSVRRNRFTFLREQLSDHLRRARGIACSPEDVVTFPTVSALLGALVDALGPTAPTVAFEDPGYITARRALTALGCEVRPYPIDADGLPALALGDERLAFVTPTHQHPLGATMSTSRRTELLTWARATGSVIVEDDHDGQFWHDAVPVPALRSMDVDGDHVVHVGMACRLLSHELKIVWAVVPPRFREAMQQHYLTHGNGVCEISGNAFGEYLAAGSFTRHLIRSSRTYTDRRDAFVAAVHSQLPHVEVSGTGAGLHAALMWDDGPDDVAVVQQLRGRGLECLPVSRFYDPASDTPRRYGLVCGYGRLPASLARPAAQLLADVLR